MKEIILSDHEAVFSCVMREFMSMLEELSLQECIMIGLSWGRSFFWWYTVLVLQLSHLDSSLRAKLRFCLLDERLVEIDHPERNGKLLHDVLFQDLFRSWLLTPWQFLEPDFSKKQFLENYTRLVSNIDIAFFGVGEDGHIASLFPNHSWLMDSQNGYFLVSDSPKPPSKRITVSKTMISKIKRSFVFFIWNSKILAYQEFNRLSTFSPKLPVSLFHEFSQVVLVRDSE